MMTCDQFYKVVAIGLIYVTATASSVVPSSDPSPLKSILGSVSAIGDVQIRGISIKQEATVFSGDQLRVGEKGYAIVLFKNGQKIELAEKTDISVTTFTNGLQIVLGSGRLGFATSNGAPITVTTGSLETVASQPAAGHVAVMGTNSIGVRVVNGNVLLRNTKTKQSWFVTAGQERLLSLGVSKPAEPITEIAS